MGQQVIASSYFVVPAGGSGSTTIATAPAGLKLYVTTFGWQVDALQSLSSSYVSLQPLATSVRLWRPNLVAEGQIDFTRPLVIAGGASLVLEYSSFTAGMILSYSAIGFLE